MNDREWRSDARDAGVDAQAIMRRIRENIRRQRDEAGVQRAELADSLDQICGSERGARFDERVYQDLESMHAIYDRIGVGLLLSGSPIPLVAPLIQRVRSMLHRLVIYYVNKLAATQADFNEYVVRTLTALIIQLDKDTTPSRVTALEEEVAQLRSQIQQLQAKGECKSE